MLEPRHGAGGKGNEHHVRQGLLEQLGHAVNLASGGNQAAGRQESALERGKTHHRADPLVIRPIGALPQHQRHFGTAVAHVVVDVSQLVMSRLVPVRGWAPRS